MKSVQQLAQEAIIQARAEGLDDDDARWMAVGAINRAAREAGVVGNELTDEMNAAAQQIVRQVGRPVEREGTYRRITLEVRTDLLAKIDASGKSRRAYIEDLLADK